MNNHPREINKEEIDIRKTGIIVSGCIAAIEKDTEHTPISEKCKLVIQEGPPCPDTSPYKTFTGQRRYVICRAFDLLEKGETKTFGDGIREAWKEIDRKCILGLPIKQ